MRTDEPIRPPPSFDEVIRARLALLIDRSPMPPGQIAAALGHEERTIRGWVSILPADRLPLSTGAADEILMVIGRRPADLLRPVLTDGDLSLLRWVERHSPMPPLRSHAHLRRLTNLRPLVGPLRYQGLIEIWGDPDDEATWYLRLTDAGRAELQNHPIH